MASGRTAQTRERRGIRCGDTQRGLRVVCSQIDVDESGDLEKAEIIDARRNNASLRPAPLIAFEPIRGESRARETRNSRVVYAQRLSSSSSTAAIKTSSTCWSRRAEAALAVLDTDRDGEIDMVEWCVSEFEAWGSVDEGAAAMACWWRWPAHRGRETAPEQARAARQGARGPGQGRREGDRQVHERVRGTRGQARPRPRGRPRRSKNSATSSARRPPGNVSTSSTSTAAGR